MTEQRDGQKECRRTLGVDAVRVLGDNIASEVTRKDIVALIMEIVDRGANVQAGSVLHELSASYEFAIGLGKFNDHFVNPAILAKAGLKQAEVKRSCERGKRALSDMESVKLLGWLPGSVSEIEHWTPNDLRRTVRMGLHGGQ